MTTAPHFPARWPGLKKMSGSLRMATEKPPVASIVPSFAWCSWSTRFGTRVRGSREWSRDTGLRVCGGSVSAGWRGCSCHRGGVRARGRPCRVAARLTLGRVVVINHLLFSCYRSELLINSNTGMPREVACYSWCP